MVTSKIVCMCDDCLFAVLLCAWCCEVVHQLRVCYCEVILTSCASVSLFVLCVWKGETAREQKYSIHVFSKCGSSQ